MPETVRDTIRTFPKKSGNSPPSGLETPSVYLLSNTPLVLIEAPKGGSSVQGLGSEILSRGFSGFCGFCGFHGLLEVLELMVFSKGCFESFISWLSWFL